MTEEWKHWEPLVGLAPKYRITSITEKTAGFTIVLKKPQDKTHIVRVDFGFLMCAYRSTQADSNVLHNFDQRNGIEFFSTWTFFEVIDSTYFAWLADESCGVTDRLSCKHFSFFGNNIIVDVAALAAPKVEFISLP